MDENGRNVRRRNQDINMLLNDYSPMVVDIPTPIKELRNLNEENVINEKKEIEEGDSSEIDKDASEDGDDDQQKDDDFCRICHDVDNEPLITPCRCRGTLSTVHRSCLEKWLAAADSSSCELCGQVYLTSRIPRYNYLPSIVGWLRSEDSCRDVRELMLDVMAFCVFTPMALLGTYLGLFAAENLYLSELETPRRDLTSTRLLTLVGMSLMATIDLAYISWLTVRTQYHIHQWYSWWRRQCTVKVILPQDISLSPQPVSPSFDKKSAEIAVPRTQNEFTQVETNNERCPTNQANSGSKNNLREDIARNDLGSGRVLSDVYKIGLYNPTRVESWCRICQESKSEDLVSPCNCRGTQGLVHISCLERWLLISGTANCEICFYPYCVKRTPKHSPFISMCVWLYRGDDKKYMVCDMAILMLLTTTMVWMIGHAWYLNNESSSQIVSPGVAFLTAVFTFAYICLLYTTIKHYYKKWLNWHKTHQYGLHVILPSECGEVF